MTNELTRRAMLAGSVALTGATELAGAPGEATPDDRPYSPGLAGVVGAESAIALVDGARGRLLYRGYPIGQLVARGTYAEVADLLWTGEWHPGAELHPGPVPAAAGTTGHNRSFR